jgi:uncharacterized protein YoxC
MPDNTNRSGAYVFGTPDLAQRMAIIETRLDHHIQDFSKYVNDLNNSVRDLNKTVSELDKKLDLIVFQRDEADKRLSRWKNVAFTVMSAGAVTLIGFLIKIAMIVQGAHLPPISP